MAGWGGKKEKITRARYASARQCDSARSLQVGSACNEQSYPGYQVHKFSRQETCFQEKVSKRCN